MANVIEMEEKSAKAAAEGPRDIGDVDTDDDKGPEEEEAQYLAWQEVCNWKTKTFWFWSHFKTKF